MASVVNCDKCGQFTDEDDTDDPYHFCEDCFYARLHRYGPEWWQIRRAVLQRDNYRCTECGMTNSECRDEYGESLSVHHVVPYEDGGTHDTENLVTLCKACHFSAEHHS
jgi:5-methylcytosine-specific restriction endonuclease McrA